MESGLFSGHCGLKRVFFCGVLTSKYSGGAGGVYSVDSFTIVREPKTFGRTDFSAGLWIFN